MATIADLYQNLFGKNHIQDGDVIEMAEHGRVGGLSTGQGVKYSQILDASGNVVSNFGGESAALATVTAIQGLAGSQAWLMTLATLSVVTQPGAGALATVTAHQGLSGVTPWLITMATMPVVGSFSISDVPVAGGSLTSYQGGAWNVLASVSGSPTVLNAGGSLSSAQLGTWTVQPGNTPNTVGWLVTMGTLPVVGDFSISSVPVAGGSLTAYQGSAPWSVLATISNNVTALNAGGSLSAYQAGTWAMTANAGTNLNTSSLALETGGNLASIKSSTDNLNVTLGSRLASGGTLPVTGNIGQLGTWTVQPGNTPNTTAWLVTMGTLPVAASFSGSIPVAGGSLTAYQGAAPWNVLASLSGSPTVLNAGGSVSAYQGGLWNVLASISGVPTVLASLPSASSFLAAGGSLTAFKNNASNAMTTMVSAATVSVILLAANAARKGASFYNNSSSILYLKNASGASLSSFKVAMAANSYFEEPSDYVGTVSGAWVSMTGSVAVTEEY